MPAFKTLFVLTSLAASLFPTFALRTRHVSCPDGKNTAVNAACCPWYPIKEDLQANLFDNECGQEAREALRLTFHDGMGYSPTAGGGGADGSIIAFSTTELAHSANNGMDDIVHNLTPFVAKYNTTPGDMVYFAAMIGLSNCPGAPNNLPFHMGRPAPTDPAPDGTISQATDNATAILTRFGEVGFSPAEVVALLASHSIAGLDGTPGLGHGDALDSTVAIFDSQFFIETQLTQPFPGLARLPSDSELARDERTACTWQSFASNEDKMREAFRQAYIKLSTVQQPVQDLIDCSEVIPDVKNDSQEPYFPGTMTVSDVDQSCTETPFPTLSQNPSVTSVAPA